MGLLKRSDDHQWSQQHLSHYVEGDLTARARRRLERHAADCPDCSRGIRAMRGLVRLIAGVGGSSPVPPPVGLFDRVCAESAGEHASPDLAREA